MVAGSVVRMVTWQEIAPFQIYAGFICTFRLLSIYLSTNFPIRTSCKHMSSPTLAIQSTVKPDPSPRHVYGG